MIRVENLEVSYFQKILLSGINLELQAGNHYGFLGPNGAGKSTLLRVLSGELAFQHGKISWRGRPLSHWKPTDLAKLRSILPQQAKVNLPFSGEELLEMGRYPHFNYFPSIKDKAIMQFISQELELSPFLKRTFSTLSGGEQQRFLLGKALVQLLEEPSWESLEGKVLLLDEPANNLDLYHQFLVMNMVEKCQQNGLTILTVFHDLNLASRYCQNLVLLKNGKIIDQGSPKEVITPQSIFQTFQIQTEVDPSGSYPQIFFPSYNPLQPNGSPHKFSF